MKIKITEDFIRDKIDDATDDQIKALTRFYNASYFDRETLSERFIYTGRAVLNNFMNHKKIDYRDLILNERDPIDIANTVSILRDFSFETFRYILVKNKVVVAQYGITTKATNKTQSTFPNKSVRQTAAEIIYRMGKYGANGFYMMHNHPSGGSSASQADISSTYTMIKEIESLDAKYKTNVAHKFKGHIIAGAKDITIFKPTDLSFDDYRIATYPIDYEEQFDIEIPNELLLHTYNAYGLAHDPDVLTLGADDKITTLIYCNRFNNDYELKIVAIQEIDNYEFKSDTVWRYIHKAAKINKATDCILVTSNEDVYRKAGMESKGVLAGALLVQGNGELVSCNFNTMTNDIPQKAYRV